LNQASIDLGKASLMAARVPDLEVRLQALQDELSSVRKDATTKAVEVGRLAGEADALRRQLTEVTAALVSLKGSPTAGI
jgi:regulator of replication initiation timing